MLQPISNSVLLVEPSHAVSQSLQDSLASHHFDLCISRDFNQAFKQILTENPSLVVTNLTSAYQEGISFCQELKVSPLTQNIPIIIYTDLHDDRAHLMAMSAGVDDYLQQSNNIEILIAHMRKRLQQKFYSEDHRPPSAAEEYITLNPLYNRCSIEHEVFRFTRTQYLLLQTLVHYPDEALSRLFLLNSVQGGEYHITQRTIDVHIASIRKILGQYRECICSVRGVGYQLDTEMLRRALTM